MKLFDPISDYIYKHQKLLAAVAVLFAFLSISFQFGNNKNEWLWTNIPFVAVILITISLAIVLIWIRMERSRINKYIDRIKTEKATKDKVDQLTNRQLEIFKMIVAGKSNKEIVAELFIEFSTLKTHINRI